MNEQKKLKKTIRILANLNDARPPDALRQAAARRAFLVHAARLRSEREQRKLGVFARAFRLTAAGLGACVLALGMLTGVVRAADAARPGDLLYPVDRGAEEFRLRLVRDPGEAADLFLSFATERLLESEELASEGDQANVAVSLEAYGQSLSDHSQAFERNGADKEAQAALIDSMLADHERRLLELRPLVTEQSYPSLDRAIEAAQKVRQNEQPRHAPENPGPPEDKPGNGKPDSTPSTRKHKQKEKDQLGGPP